MLVAVVAWFIWAHRTVAAGLACLWNFAFIFIGPATAPPQVSRALTAGVPLAAAIIFAALFVVSLIYDSRKRRRARDDATSAR